jgi:hypothetical protein
MRTFFLATAVVAAVLFLALTAQAERIFCVVIGYKQISPTEMVGFSNCGSVWKVVFPNPLRGDQVPRSLGVAESDSAEAWYWDPGEGSWNQLGRVPAPGDTLGFVDQ